MKSTKDHVRAYMQSKFGHTDGQQGSHGAGTIGRSGGSGGGTVMLDSRAGAGSPPSDFSGASAGAGSHRSGGTGGGTTVVGAGTARVAGPDRRAMPNPEMSNIYPDGAGAGTHDRHGGTGNPGGPDPGAFKGGKAGLGTPKLAKAMDEHVAVGNPRNDGNIAGFYSRQMDINDVGDNRAHVNGGRDRAMQSSRDTGGVHPMEHAGKMGKGRW